MARVVLLTLVLSVFGASALTVRSMEGSVRFIEGPEPEDFAQTTIAYTSIENKEHKPWVAMKAPPLAKGEQMGKSVTIIGYPANEDREISGSLIATNGTWETFHIKDMCQPWANGHKGIFLDVGANIGTYTLPMADCIHGQGSVVAIEAMPEIADHLRAGIVTNQMTNVVLYSYAVGDGDRENVVTMGLDPVNKGGSAVTGNKPEQGTEFEHVTVNLTTIDAILSTNKRLRGVLSMKVDIEGNEGRMLMGAQRFFGHYPPCYLTIELIHEWLESAQTPVEEILEQLRYFGYANLPTAEYLKTCRWRSRTIHVQQKDLEACRMRVDSTAEKLAKAHMM